ncbi:archease [Nitrosospira lacus]|uniref:Archease n=1 Tax=Nitrosospira lacus TaxID=1288494 RepID=A0A1W6SNU7_9PROT|nr:archease [Nitrosospira lacus]ARO87498.1 archease [Nitrosospira lacus]
MVLIEAEENRPVTAESSRYFEHDADVGIIGCGSTVEQAFEAGAQALFAIVTNLDAVQPTSTVTFEFEETDSEFAFVTWLNLLLGKSRELGMVFSRFHVRHIGNRWRAEASGEKWYAGMERGVEVKGATLTMLSVKQSGSGWEARCVVDV